MDTLLTVDGLKFLKELSLRNLDYRAEDSKEVAMLNSFMQKAKDVRTGDLNVILNVMILRKGGSVNSLAKQRKILGTDSELRRII